MNESFLPFINKFENVASNFPNNIAVKSEKESLTYNELQIRVQNLATNFTLLGIQPNDVIGVCSYNDIDLIATILAIWKCRAVYLPLDPHYPNLRIKKMLKDSAPAFIVTKKIFRKKFEYCISNVIYLEKLVKSKSKIPFSKPSPDDISYIFYTSGSAGSPKGILVDQKALKHAATAYSFFHPHRLIAFFLGSISFDPSLLILVHTFYNGGMLCLYSNKEGIDISDYKKICSLINYYKIEFILTTPSFYEKILSFRFEFPNLKIVDLCGEVLSSKLVKSHRTIVPHAMLNNCYGPSEYAIGISGGTLYSPLNPNLREISIGKPFCKSSKIFIVDETLKLNPVEQKGEIIVAGPGLAVGYLNLKKLTQEKFVWIRDLDGNLIRVYKTGDIGYQTLSGDFIYCGRSDFQVKINGHRVEIEEIESTISRISGVEKAVVILTQNEQSKNQLIAFYTSSEKRIDEKFLKKSAAKILPSYMLPFRFICLEDWPHTRNGKIDRKKLRSMI